jgi:DNA repair exonuclease SbcCD ATPase subunit
MEKTCTEKPFEMMEQKLTQYRNLKERREKLQQLLENAEEHRSTVDDKIYQKVKVEYDQQLSETVSDLSPIGKEISEERESARLQLVETEEELQALQEQVEETSFRHRIGEYSQDKLTDLEHSLSPMIEEKKQKREQFSKLLQRIDEALECPAPVVDRNNSYADQVISELADPVEEDSVSVNEDTHSDANEKQEQTDEDELIPFPNLIITSGSQSGKKIPVLPMTMTIGREHDNNIEIKDEEVARYHARVIYQDSHFVLQDLNSSTGTWVNGEQIKQASLKNLDKIRFGETEMIIDFS